MQKTFLVHRTSKDSFFLTGLLRKNRVQEGRGGGD
jgi:hypothetical protein